jgi:hypothetical protein
MANYFILMGDVVASRRVDARELRRHLKSLVASCNSDLKSLILSPYTITLGDEFQGIALSLRAIAESIFYFEETRVKKKYHFKLHYVGHYGEIQTPINREIAYEMMGPGLTQARALLTDRYRGRPRFVFDLPDRRLSNNLTRLCKVIDSITDRWNVEDYPLIADMLMNSSNAEVAVKHDKNRSQIWKRRKHLLITEYKLIKDVLLELVDASEGKVRR